MGITKDGIKHTGEEAGVGVRLFSRMQGLSLRASYCSMQQLNT